MTDRPITGRGWAYAGVVLGGAVSIAANVAHSYVPPKLLTGGVTVAGWSPEPGAVAGAVFWPLALFVAIEILARTNWPELTRWVLLRFGGLIPVGVVAAVVSYRHMSGLLEHYGEDSLTVAIGPLAVDGLMVVATGALIATGGRLLTRTEPVVEVAPPVVVEATVPEPLTPSPVTAADVAPAAPKARPRKATPRRPARRAGGDSDMRQTARQKVRAGKSCAEVALALGTNKRNVERWTKDLRDNSATTASQGGA